MKVLRILAVAGAIAIAAMPAAAQSKVERYTKAQTAPAYAAMTRIVRVDAAPSVTRTHPYDNPAYPGGTPAPEAAGVRVFRGGHQGASRPCSWRSSLGVTTYSGCGTYGGTVPELAGGQRTDGVRPGHLPVIGISRGSCTRKIRRLEPASADTRPYEVCYADLQPVYGRRAGRLYERIAAAAHRACKGQAGYGAWQRREACEAVAVDTAVYRSGLQSLLEHHLEVTGNRPRLIVEAAGRY